MQPRRMIVTDTATQSPRQSSVWLISTFAEEMSPHLVIVFSVICLFCGNIAVASPDERQPIGVFINEAPAKEGLSVEVLPDEKKKSDSQSLHFVLHVTNLFSDEIFLTVTEFDDIGFSLKEKTATMNRGMSSGGGKIVFPDNVGLLKRLHGSIGSNGDTTVTCGCCVAAIPISISAHEGTSFSEWAGIPGSLRIPIKGYFRSTGREFSEYVEVPFIVPKNINEK